MQQQRRFPEVALAQVEAVFPDTFELGIVLPNFGSLHAIRVKVAAQHAGPYTGEYMLPKVGEFGMVAFLQDDARSGIWTTTIPSSVWNTAPLEIMQADPTAKVTHSRDGARAIEYSSGDREALLPDGTLLRVTASKDGSTSNTTGRSKRTPMRRSVDEDPGRNSRKAVREDYTPPQVAPVDVRLEHSSGAILTITADGSFHLTTPKGHAFKLHDATEKSRDSADPLTVTGTPEEDAGRVASEVVLQSELGHKLTFHDDPVNALERYVKLEHPTGLALELFDDPGPGASRYARLSHPFGHALELFHDPKVNVNAYAELRSGGGHKLLLRDLDPANIHVLVQTAAGHMLELRDTPAADSRIKAMTVGGLMLELHDVLLRALVQTPGGRQLILDDGGAKTSLIDPVRVDVTAPDVRLAGGDKGPAAFEGGIVSTVVGPARIATQGTKTKVG
jgi:hypothetical protein